MLHVLLWTSQWPSWLLGRMFLCNPDPPFWLYPFATNLALYLCTSPDALYFTLKIHLHPIGTFSGGKSTVVHVWLSSKAAISSCIAFIHFGSTTASLKVCGSVTDEKVVKAFRKWGVTWLWETYDERGISLRTLSHNLSITVEVYCVWVIFWDYECLKHMWSHRLLVVDVVLQNYQGHQAGQVVVLQLLLELVSPPRMKLWDLVLQ